MKQLIYRSRPFGFDHAMLAGILVQARHNNRRHAITGALICRHDLYLQMIEGSQPAIDALYAKITLDDRHCNVDMLLNNTTDTRLFPEWDMLDDTVPTMTWQQDAVEGGAIEAAEPDALLKIFERIAIRARSREAVPQKE